MKHSSNLLILALGLVVTSMLSLSACRKESTVDLSLRFGNWTVTQSSEPSSGVNPSIPDEHGIFDVGDKIEYTAGTGNTERLRLLRTVQINGRSQPYEDYFLCTLDGDKLTLREETYGSATDAGHAVIFTYQIQRLDGRTFVLKRTDLGKDEGVVTLTRK